MDDETTPAPPWPHVAPSDRKLTGRTAAASEARRKTTDWNQAERLRGRGYIVFKHDPTADPMPEGLKQALKPFLPTDLPARNMVQDALTVAYHAGWLSGVKEKSDADEKRKERDRETSILRRSIGMQISIDQAVADVVREELNEKDPFAFAGSTHVDAGHRVGCSCRNVDIPCNP